MGIKIYTNELGHLTKMAVMPIYGKNLLKSSPLEPMDRWLWHLVPKSYQDCSNDDLGLTLAGFIARLNTGKC